MEKNRITQPMTKPVNTVRRYVNLTAGLVDIEDKDLLSHVVFCYLKSSHIEAKAYDKFFNSIPDDMLMHLALGTTCFLIDASSNRSSKVIRIGIPIINYVLNKRWFGKEINTGQIEKKWIDEMVIGKFEKYTKQRIDYYKQFLMVDEVCLIGINIRLEKEDGKEIIKNFRKLFDY